MSDTAPRFAFDGYLYTGATASLELDGFTLTATIQHDDTMGAPWDEHDGHGDVTKWTRADTKGPGDRMLCRDGHLARFYDFAGAVRKARREGWRAPGCTGGTARQVAARAAEHDFNVLRAWCANEWHWCGVVVEVEREGVKLGRASLWGIEDANYPGSDGAYLVDTASELIDEALDDARATLARLCQSAA